MFYVIYHAESGRYNTHHRSWTMPALYKTKGIAEGVLKGFRGREGWRVVPVELTHMETSV